ncbi:MAG TPA: trigger factor [Candidatus Saccharimonadales bacterium]|nr:trigger factor [Candidatus Saccharimonadales bacterium]
MQVALEKLNPTKFKLTITADSELLLQVKGHVLGDLAKQVKLPGFRAGKAPAELVEKNVDQSVLQQEFLEHAVNELYTRAVQEKQLRPVAQPQVSIAKFVPFSTLEITAEVEAVGDITLGDYKKVKLARPVVTVTDKDVNEVLKNLQLRAATREEVKRAGAEGDEVWIDFKGVDAKTKEPVAGADGKDYPLLLGSDTFIPGFEDNLTGVKAGGNKEFTLTFPKDYGVKTLQNRKVTFNVTVNKVQKVAEPKLDDKFAAGVGPFKTLQELKTDVKAQLEQQRRSDAERTYESQLLEKVAEKSHAAIPEVLVEEEVERLEQEERQNVAYRGQTWQEHLDAEGVTAEEHRTKNRPAAELRVKAGMVLGEIARRENIEVTSEELELRLQLLKGQYQDAAMQAQLDKPENVRDIASRLLTEKTLDILKSYAAQNA